MATHSPIMNAEIDVDSPVTEALLTKYRENPIADFEGDGTGVAFAALAEVTAGNIDIDGMSPISPQITSYAVQELWNVYTAGTYRIRLHMQGVSSSSTLYARIYRNGAAYGTERSVTNTTATYSQDLSFDVGDTIEIWGRRSASGIAGVIAARISIAAPYHVNIHSPGLDPLQALT